MRKPLPQYICSSLGVSLRYFHSRCDDGETGWIGTSTSTSSVLNAEIHVDVVTSRALIELSTTTSFQPSLIELFHSGAKSALKCVCLEKVLNRDSKFRCVTRCAMLNCYEYKMHLLVSGVPSLPSLTPPFASVPRRNPLNKFLLYNMPIPKCKCTTTYELASDSSGRLPSSTGRACIPYIGTLPDSDNPGPHKDSAD